MEAKRAKDSADTADRVGMQSGVERIKVMTEEEKEKMFADIFIELRSFAGGSEKPVDIVR